MLDEPIKPDFETHPVVSHAEWLEARKRLLAREKEETRLRDAVNAERLALPWERVEKEYRFQTPAGEKSLADLFEGRSQLVVYHFMLGPDWAAGCPGCSFVSETFDGALAHLTHHDVSFTAVSRAPLSQIEAYRARMGWRFPWVSSYGGDFNFDYRVSLTPDEIAAGRFDFNYRMLEMEHPDGEQPGMSAFYRNAAGELFHTYSSYARGLEQWIGTLMILDRAPKGRNEDSTMSFVRRHDEYEDAATGAACCHR